MTLLNLKWSSASSRVDRVPRGACGARTARQRSFCSTNAPARQQEKPRDTAASRLKSAKSMGVSGSKPAFSPQPPPQQSRERYVAEQHASFQQESAGPKRNGAGVKIGRGSTAAPSTKTQPLRRILPVPALEMNVQREKRISQFESKHDGATSTVETGATLMATTARERAAGCGGTDGVGFRQLPSTTPPEQLMLTRSGSAPSSSTMALTNASTTATSGSPTCQPVEVVRSSLLAGLSKSKCAPSENEADFARTTRSCWDERRDTIVTVEAVTPLQDAAAPTRGKAAAKPNVAKVPPLRSAEQEGVVRGPGKQKQRLVPLHRRKSDMVDGRFRGGARNICSAHSKATSSGHEPPLAKRRSTTSDAPRPSTTSSTSTAHGGGSGRRASRSSDTATDLGGDQGHLKARLRVMEWKRRRAQDLEAQQEEQATLEQKQQAEADTEAARKLATVRAEEAERQINVERENTADAIRAAEVAEKWAKTSRQRDRRRAEIYAINAVMRTAFEKEFEAYRLEQEERATQATVPEAQDPPQMSEKNTPPQQ